MAPLARNHKLIASLGLKAGYTNQLPHACLPILCSSAIASFPLLPMMLLLLLLVVGMLIARLTSTSLPMLANFMFFCNCFLPLVANDAAAAAAGRGDAYSTSDQHACLPILCSSAIASFPLLPMLLLLLLLLLVVGMLIARLTSMHACQFYVHLQLLPSSWCQYCCCCCCWSWGCL